MTLLDEQIAQARKLLQTARHAAMATVNAEDSPHNTPYYLLFEDDLSYFYWASKPEAMHSQNVERAGKAYVVIYDTHESSGGLYVQLEDAERVPGEDLDRAIASHTKARAKVGKAPVPKEQYDAMGQVFYRARPVAFWVYAVERDPHTNFIVHEGRQQVSASDLL